MNDFVSQFKAVILRLDSCLFSIGVPLSTGIFNKKRKRGSRRKKDSVFCWIKHPEGFSAVLDLNDPAELLGDINSMLLEYPSPSTSQVNICGFRGFWGLKHESSFCTMEFCDWETPKIMYIYSGSTVYYYLSLPIHTYIYTNMRISYLRIIYYIYHIYIYMSI